MSELAFTVDMGGMTNLTLALRHDGWECFAHAHAGGDCGAAFRCDTPQEAVSTAVARLHEKVARKRRSVEAAAAEFGPIFGKVLA